MARTLGKDAEFCFKARKAGNDETMRRSSWVELVMIIFVPNVFLGINEDEPGHAIRKARWKKPSSAEEQNLVVMGLGTGGCI